MATSLTVDLQNIARKTGRTGHGNWRARQVELDIENCTVEVYLDIVSSDHQGLAGIALRT